MRIGLVNLITKTADVDLGPSALRTGNLAPATDRDLNIVDLGRRMTARGHEVTIFVADTYKPKRTGGTSGPAVKYVKTRLPFIFPPSLAPLTPSLSRILRKERLDVVQSGEVFHPGTVLSWTGTREGDTRMFVWQELDTLMRGPAGWAQKQFYATLGKGLVKGCAAIIPRSLSARNHLLEYGTLDTKIAPVVHSGVDTMLFRPMNKFESRGRFGVEEDRNVILSVGRLHQNKGMDILIRAMGIVRARDPDALLVIKGTGPATQELRGLVSSLHLEDNVWIINDHLSKGDMAALYNCADVLGIASRVDLFPFTAIEAISCGVPVATSFARGLKTDIVDKGAGAMIRPRPEDMAQDLLALLDDPVVLERLGKTGRELALREFDFEVGAERLLSIYGGSCG